MTGLKRRTNDALRIGRRTLEGVPGIEILKDWQWIDSISIWVLTLRLSLPHPVGYALPHLPPQTDWCVLADEQYPASAPRFYPAKEGGISATFPHQLYNGPGSSEVPWRMGNLCLDRAVRALGHAHLDDEPRTPQLRLAWRCQRALEWLAAADANQLLHPDDPWEMPHFPTQDLKSNIQRFVFCEDGPSFDFWRSSSYRCGLAEIAAWRNSPNGRNHTFVVSFLSPGSSGEEQIWRPDWGTRLSRIAQEVSIQNGRKKQKKKTVPPVLEKIPWVRLDACPIIDPWAAPSTWRELKSAVVEQGLDIYDLLLTAVPGLRDQRRHIALIGFPIPERVGCMPERMHWQALQLPPLSPTPNGFRANHRKSLSLHDQTHGLRGTAELDWIQSENWHSEQLASRGRYHISLREHHILLIGAGALGSGMAELLVRAGVGRITIVDADIVVTGNLVRHILTVEDIDAYKAKRLAVRLNSISPTAKIDSITGAFPPQTESLRKLVQDATLILDTTAENSVIADLANYSWSKNLIFVSCSLGWRAQLLWMFSMQSERFSAEAFNDYIEPELEAQRQRWGTEMADENAPREGIGCWHPVFPARLDDIWLMASLATKKIEKLAIEPPEIPCLDVWEQKEHGISYKRICREESPLFQSYSS